MCTALPRPLVGVTVQINGAWGIMALITRIFNRNRTWDRVRRWRRTAQTPNYAHSYDLEKLPPGTFILYPELLGRSFTDDRAEWELSNSARRETTTPGFLNDANLNYFLRYASFDDMAEAQRNIRDILAPAKQAENDAAQPQSENAGTHTTYSAEIPALRWNWFRGAFCYIAVGFIACLGMFMVPLLRQPNPGLPMNGGSKFSRTVAPAVDPRPSANKHPETASISPQRRHHPARDVYEQFDPQPK